MFLDDGRLAHVVALTGGPCAGKTTALSRLVSEFRDRGWSVVTVPEAATQLVSAGIRPQDMGVVEFQTVAMDVQLAHEDAALAYARASSSGRTLVLCDRGCVDQAAYMTEAERDEVCRNVGVRYDDLFGRYDQVVHLRTAAYGAEDAYTLANNGARTETVAQARAVDDAQLALWASHPHVTVVGNEGDFERKLRDATNAIAEAVGEPAVADRARKLVVEAPSPAWFASCEASEAVEVDTAYLPSEEGVERRVRRVERDGLVACSFTRKVDAGDGSRLVFERAIDASEHSELTRVSERGNSKVRRLFARGGVRGVVDDYGTDDGLAVMELRWGDAGRVPEGVRVVADVTDNASFRDAALSAEPEGWSLAGVLGRGLRSEPSFGTRASADGPVLSPGR